MTKTRSTKSALISSVVALLLCFAMLLGSTFAWFTDSVTSANNIIKSGTLDVEMYYADGTLAVPADDSADWKNAQGVALYTADQLWEPGYTDAKHIKISNEGTLALKYQLAIVPTGEVSKLADVIDVYLYEIADTDENATQVENRTDLDETMWVGTLADVISKGIVQGNLAADTDYTTTIVLKMQESAGNEYQDLSIGDDFTIQLLATQVTAESDSFDDQYDADAWMPGMIVYSEDDLNAAIANGGNVVLGADVELQSYVTVAEGSTVAINLNGHKLSAVSGNVIRNNGQLTIVNGTLEGTTTYTVNNESVNGSVKIEDVKSVKGGFFNAGTMVVNNCEITNTASGKHAVYHSGSSLTVNGGTYTSTSNNELINASAAATPAVINNGTFTMIGKSYLLNNVIINGGTFNGYVNENGTNDGMRPNVTVNGGTFNFDPTSHVADGFKVVKNGEFYYVVADGVDNIILSADDLLALSGKYVVGNNGTAETITYALMADIDLGGAEFKELGVAYGDTVNFLGNGHTISNFKLSTGSHNGMTNIGMFYVDTGATLNVSNLTLNGVTVADGVDTYTTGAAVVVGYANGAVNLTDVDVNKAKVNNTYGNAAIYVGYGVNEINLSDCDVADSTVSGEVENGAVRTDKTGAYVGTANTTSCVVTVTNCTNETAYPDFGRVINGATWNGITYVSNATQLTDAVAAGTTNIYLNNGTYNISGCNGRTLTISGSKEAVLNIANEGENGLDYAFDGSTVTFNGVTFDTTANNGTYRGYARMSATYNDCDFVGTYTTSSGSHAFYNCNFDLRNNYVWTWGSSEVIFDTCKFEDANGVGKAILVHEGAAVTNVTVRNCTFVASTAAYTWDGLYVAAVSIDPNGADKQITVNFEGTNTVVTAEGATADANGNTGFAGLHQIKNGNESSQITVKVDGEVVDNIVATDFNPNL